MTCDSSSPAPPGTDPPRLQLASVADPGAALLPFPACPPPSPPPGPPSYCFLHWRALASVCVSACRPPARGSPPPPGQRRPGPDQRPWKADGCRQDLASSLPACDLGQGVLAAERSDLTATMTLPTPPPPPSEGRWRPLLEPHAMLPNCGPGTPVTLGLRGQPFGEKRWLFAGMADEMRGRSPTHPESSCPLPSASKI